MIRPAALLICIGLAACSAQVGDVEYLRKQPTTIATITDSELTYFVDRPDSDQPVPIILTIDGSSCRGPTSNGFDQVMIPDETAYEPYARVFVAKPGVGLEDDGTACTEDFLKNYTVDQRVTDHLRVLQHLRTKADWWDGRLYIWGWSDGGGIGSRLTAYYPNVERAVLGGMGGGTTMFEQFRDVHICPETPGQPKEEREACVDNLSKQFEQITNNPTWKRSWAGEENTFRVWASRINARLTNILIDTDTPILIVHGANDVESVPVTSARKLVEDLKAAGRGSVTYWEIPDMAHSIRSLPESEQQPLKNAMRDWLLVGDSVKMPEPE